MPVTSTPSLLVFLSISIVSIELKQQVTECCKSARIPRKGIFKLVSVKDSRNIGVRKIAHEFVGQITSEGDIYVILCSQR